MFAGSVAVFIDFIFYFLSIGIFGPIVSKLIGFYAGVVVSYMINGRYTFVQTNKQFVQTNYFFKYIIALTISMLLNVTINYFVLEYLKLMPSKFILAFIVATSFSMTFNFLAMKYWIFK